jgi:hypothetical protein
MAVWTSTGHDRLQIWDQCTTERTKHEILKHRRIMGLVLYAERNQILSEDTVAIFQVADMRKNSAVLLKSQYPTAV